MLSYAPGDQVAMNELVFVGGIHGVGKTSISRRLAEMLPAVHVTAGTLIRDTASSGHIVTVGVGNKAVPDVDGNQELLLRGLASFRIRIGAKQPLLLDGHFCLLDPSGNVTEISLDVFAAMEPAAVLLVTAEPETVRARLMQRDAASPPLDVIAQLSNREKTRAVEVVTALAIPMWSVRGDVELEVAARSAAGHLRSCLTGAA
jgi:adenylate kinase